MSILSLEVYGRLLTNPEKLPFVRKNWFHDLKRSISENEPDSFLDFTFADLRKLPENKGGIVAGKKLRKSIFDSHLIRHSRQ